MRLVTLALLAAACLAAAAGAQTRKKLIEFGWDLPYPDDLRRNIREMEKRPFDGVVVRPRAAWNVFRKQPLDPAKFETDIADLKATRFERFTDNFLLVWATTDEGWDWTSDTDWRAAEANIRLMARIAKAGRFVGIMFDPEPYGPNPWDYKKRPRAGDLSFAEYARIVRRCGARFLRIVQQEIRDPRILTLFHVSLFGDLLDEPDPAKRQQRLASHEWGLLAPFLDGMLDAAEPRTVIIDGNEFAYYYPNSEGFYRAVHTTYRRALALVDPRNHAKYARQVQLGQALYMDLTFALQPNPERLPAFRLTPEQRARWFEHNVYQALYTADEIVWCYSERMDWWKGNVPPGAEEAIRSARSKIEAGKPLGFSLDFLSRP